MATLGVTQGLRGWFAVLYDSDGPIQTGIGSYSTAEGASKEAIEWWEAEGRVYSLEKGLRDDLPPISKTRSS
jgi:hypothetical protein